jgi:phage terminase large subunit
MMRTGVQLINWRRPDYDAVFAARMQRLNNLRGEPAAVTAGLREFYRDHPAEFISDWGMTFDPRNAEIGQKSVVPFVLFPKQVEFINWLHARWRAREDGLVEKSRDMGASWLCVAFAAWMWLFHAGTVIGFGSRKEEYVDKLGDPKSLFWKLRQFVNLLPQEFQPKGWDDQKYAPHMRILNPENDSAIVGEAGDNIGRGNRTSIYFKDESAFYEHAEAIDAALSQTSNCKLDVSTPNGAGNAFYRKRHGGKVKVFVLDWHDDPRKSKAWYENQKAILDPVIVAQEIDRDYESSVSNSWVPSDLVLAAVARGPADVPAVGRLRVGVDVARFGDDKTVITFRRGRVLIKQSVYAKFDVTQVAGQVKADTDAFGEPPEQIAVDTIGIGAGVADILRGWYGKEVVRDVNSALRLADGQNYNLRSFIWREMREWLKTASIPNDQELKSDLTALRYSFRGGEVLMEDKNEAKKRGIKSPDRADSLGLTFAYPTVAEEILKPIPSYGILDSVVGL